MAQATPMRLHGVRRLRRTPCRAIRRAGLVALVCAGLLALLPPATRARSAADDVSMDRLSQLSLEELLEIDVESVYGASKYLQKSTEAPAAVTIITADEIWRCGYRTLADALRTVRGFYLTSDRNYDYLAVRGFGRVEDYNARILLLVDGHRVNDNIYEAAMLGTEFPVDAELVERIEIVRGPSSSIYGSNAFLGVVNVVTRRGNAVPGVEASGGLATYNSGKGRLTLGRALPKRGDLLVSGSLYTSDGPRRLYFKELDTPAMNSGVALNGDADRSQQFFSNLAYRDFALQAVYGSRTKNVPTGAWGTLLNDNRNRTRDVRGWLDLGWRHTFAEGLELSGRLAYDSYDFDGGYVSDYSVTDTPLVVVNVDRNRGRWWGGELNARGPLPGGQKLLVGSEFRRNVRQDQLNFDRDPYAVLLEDHRSSTTWALYGEDEVQLARSVLLNVGLRHDHYPRFGSSTNPRLGLILAPVPRTTAKLLYGSAFRVPTAYELFFGGDGYQPNPDLKPERVRTWEFVLERYFGRHHWLTGSLYSYRVLDLISQREADAGGGLQYANGPAIRSRGAELEFGGRWSGGAEGRLSYSLQLADSLRAGRRLLNSPQHLAQLNLIVPLFTPALFLGSDARYLSRRNTLAGRSVPGHFQWNLTLTARFCADRLEVAASGYNVLDSRYADPGSREHPEDAIEQNGRQVRLSVSVRP